MIRSGCKTTARTDNRLKTGLHRFFILDQFHAKEVPDDATQLISVPEVKASRWQKRSCSIQSDSAATFLRKPGLSTKQQLPGNTSTPPIGHYTQPAKVSLPSANTLARDGTDN